MTRSVKRQGVNNTGFAGSEAVLFIGPEDRSSFFSDNTVAIDQETATQILKENNIEPTAVGPTSIEQYENGVYCVKQPLVPPVCFGPKGERKRPELDPEVVACIRKHLAIRRFASAEPPVLRLFSGNYVVEGGLSYIFFNARGGYIRPDQVQGGDTADAVVLFAEMVWERDWQITVETFAANGFALADDGHILDRDGCMVGRLVRHWRSEGYIHHELNLDHQAAGALSADWAVKAAWAREKGL